MSTTASEIKRYDILHAREHLGNLGNIILAHPQDIVVQIANRINSMTRHPAHKHKNTIEGLALSSVADTVSLKYDEMSADQILKHKFMFKELGHAAYSRSFIDRDGEYYPDVVSLKSNEEIVSHPDVVKQLLWIVPMIMISVNAIYGPNYVQQVTEIGQKLFSGNL